MVLMGPYGNTDNGHHQHRPPLLQDHGRRHGQQQQQLWPWCHHLGGNAGHSDQHCSSCRVALGHLRGSTWWPRAKASKWSSMVTGAMDIKTYPSFLNCQTLKNSCNIIPTFIQRFFLSSLGIVGIFNFSHFHRCGRFFCFYLLFQWLVLAASVQVLILSPHVLLHEEFSQTLNLVSWIFFFCLLLSWRFLVYLGKSTLSCILFANIVFKFVVPQLFFKYMISLEYHSL